MVRGARCCDSESRQGGKGQETKACCGAVPGVCDFRHDRRDAGLRLARAMTHLLSPVVCSMLGIHSAAGTNCLSSHCHRQKDNGSTNCPPTVAISTTSWWLLEEKLRTQKKRGIYVKGLIYWRRDDNLSVSPSIGSHAPHRSFRGKVAPHTSNPTSAFTAGRCATRLRQYPALERGRARRATKRQFRHAASYAQRDRRSAGAGGAARRQRDRDHAMRTLCDTRRGPARRLAPGRGLRRRSVADPSRPRFDAARARATE